MNDQADRIEHLLVSYETISAELSEAKRSGSDEDILYLLVELQAIRTELSEMGQDAGAGATA